MKILINKTAKLGFILSLIVMLSNCKEDSVNKNACDIYNIPTDYKIEKELGRVYLRDEGSDDKFYYIGNPDSTQRLGGYIPCDFPKNFIPTKKIGELVIYSGNVRDYDTDQLDPLYLGLDLTLIEFYSSVEE